MGQAQSDRERSIYKELNEILSDEDNQKANRKRVSQKIDTKEKYRLCTRCSCQS